MKQAAVCDYLKQASPSGDNFLSILNFDLLFQFRVTRTFQS